MLCYDMIYCVILCYIMSCVVLCYVTLCHAMLSCVVMLCHVVLCPFLLPSLLYCILLSRHLFYLTICHYLCLVTRYSFSLYLSDLYYHSLLRSSSLFANEHFLIYTFFITCMTFHLDRHGIEMYGCNVRCAYQSSHEIGQETGGTIA